MSYSTARLLLENTVTRIDGAYAPSTIRAYRCDFAEFIGFCEEDDSQALPAEPETLARFITKLSNSGRTSASIRRAVAGIGTIHRLNRFVDPSKDPDVILEMKRMHRKLGRAAHQAQGITFELLEKLLGATDETIHGIRNRALLLVAYDTLCRRSELVSLQIQDVKTSIKDEVEHTTIFLRRSKTDQEATGRWLHLSERAQIALRAWLKTVGEASGPLFRGVTKAQKITKGLGSGQVNRIYKKAARIAKLDENLIQRISGHSCRVGAAQDLVNSGASMPIIMQKGRWSKTDTVMRYVEHISYAA